MDSQIDSNRRARDSMDKLLAWVGRSPQVTLDPLDLKGHPWFTHRLASRDRILSRWALRAAYAAEAFCPRVLRRLFRIQPLQTAGAAATMAQGFLGLYRCRRSASHLLAAESWLYQLQRLRLSRYQDYVWGFPFPWQTEVLIPAETPLLYTTWQAAQAFFDHYQLTGELQSLAIVRSALQAILTYFRKVADTEEELALSYSPHDEMQVININAQAGGILCRFEREDPTGEWARDGSRLINWVTRMQREDGAWEYFTRDTRRQGSSVDHFHMAMTLSGIAEAVKNNPDSRWLRCLEKGTNFYLFHLFAPNGRPRFTPSRDYPVDILSCAEGILFLSRLMTSLSSHPRQMRETPRERLENLVSWTCENMQDHCGAFYDRLYPIVKLRLFSHRWGQGPMLMALSSYLNGTE